MNDLLIKAADLIREHAPEQTRYKVTEEVAPRTLRFYVREGLVDGPAGYDGTSSVYGDRHLYQLVAIKKLQSEYLPLKKIKEILSGLDVDALLRLIGEPPPPEPPAPQMADLMDAPGSGGPQAATSDIVFDEAMEEKAAAMPTQAPQASSARRRGIGEGLLNAIFGRSKKKAETPPKAPKPPPPSAEPSPESWERHELVPGLEVHIRADFLTDRPKSFLRLLVVRFQTLLEKCQRR